jgi:hypothetical protein
VTRGYVNGSAVEHNWFSVEMLFVFSGIWGQEKILRSFFRLGVPSIEALLKHEKREQGIS